MLLSIYFIFYKMLLIFLFYLFVQIMFVFLNHARNFKQNSGCLKLKELSRCMYTRSTPALTQWNSPVSCKDLSQAINIHYHITPSATPRSPKWSFPARFPTKTFLFFSTRTTRSVCLIHLNFYLQDTW